MPDPIRYHLDEQMDPDIATALRRAGIDITTSLDQGLLSRPDEEQWDRVRAQGRVLITDDQDFLAIAAAAADHPGVVYCRRTKHSMGEIINFLILCHGVYEAYDMVGRVEYVS
jgi:predicted nuclease of predicted toxin-antitoxin system